MKKILIIAAFTALILSCEPAPPVDTSGVVVVTCNLETADLTYAGMYVWVTDSSDDYVCTINYFLTGEGYGLLFHYGYDDNPDEWISATGLNPSDPETIDGVSCATQTIDAGSPLTFTSSRWDLTDTSGALVADGTYTIHVQITAEGFHDATDYYTAEVTVGGQAGTVSMTESYSEIMTSGSVLYTP